ncbi:MAG TPA: chorismate-binding protein [Salinimicrobium sp.]|nr:chorismate-binding protein [Salinimicrobium sp.]
MTGDEFFSRLKKHYYSGLPFVAYRLPEKRQLRAFLQNSNKLHLLQSYAQNGFVMAPFKDTEKAVIIPQDASEELFCKMPETETGNTPLDGLKESGKKINFANSDDHQRHLELVQSGIRSIQNGLMKKVVLSRKEKLQSEAINPFEIFRNLLELYPSAFVYVFFHPEIGLWSGATPETLIEIRRNRYKTMALAGTQRYKGTLQVEWREKEKQEQQYVTDFIMDNLQDALPESSPERSKVYSSRAGNLIHLRTDITGILPPGEQSLERIVNCLHPTPAVCGFPREAAKEFILKQEGYDREFYTGFLGELNLRQLMKGTRSGRNIENMAYRQIRTETSLFVNLRCTKIKDNDAFLYLGGGITEDSDPQEEWIETGHKGQTMKNALLK